MQASRENFDPASFVLPKQVLRFGSVVVIEWLGPQDRRTGAELVSWMTSKGYDASRPIRLIVANSADDSIAALQDVAREAESSGVWPLLHIEAHGDEVTGGSPRGWWGPNGRGQSELLTWDRVAPELLKINIASQCNLLLVSAACWGQAVILGASGTSRLPFVASIGFSTSISERSLLEATKEFYRGIFNAPEHLEDVIKGARFALGEHEGLEWDSMPQLTLEAFEQSVYKYNTEDERRRRSLNIAMRLVGDGNLPDLSQLPYSTAIKYMNQDQERSARSIWNRRFMIDLFPLNAERFAVDVEGFVRHALDNIGREEVLRDRHPSRE